VSQVRCGYCQVDFLDHPVEQCKYTYTPILDEKGLVIGYHLIDSPLRAIYVSDQPQT
jgi:hypothetical protein